MASGLRKRKAEVPDEPAVSDDIKAPEVQDADWQELSDPFMIELEAEAPIAPAPASARPARPPKAPPRMRKSRRSVFLTYASFVLLFIVVASLSAAIVLIFA